MYELRKILKGTACVASLLFALPAAAVPFSISNAYLDLNTLSISSGELSDEPFVESFLEVSENNSTLDLSNDGMAPRYDYLSNDASSASVELTEDGTLELLTISESSLPESSHSAFAETALFLPFSLPVQEQISITADYGVFGAAESTGPDDYAAAFLSSELSILTKDFVSVGNSVSEDYFVESFYGDADDGFNFYGPLNLEVEALSAGDYYLAFNLSGGSITERGAASAKVPEPSVLLLLALGLLLIAYLNRDFPKVRLM